MSNKDYDLIVFGASGFTGQYVAEEVARIADEEQVTWAVAGRDTNKLKTVLQNVKKATGKSVDDVGVIVADISDQKSLNAMASKGRVVLNCVGPYRFYGEAVVKACVENGASHVDISGEPQYMERMQLEYNDAARENRVYVVQACGFDSIPADMGIVLLENKFDGQVNSVETFLGIKTKKLHLNFGTWQSAVYLFGHANELKSIRRKLFPSRLPELKPKLRLRGVLFDSPVSTQERALMFLGVDRSVVMRSQRYFYEKESKRPIQMNSYLLQPSLFLCFGWAIAFGLLVVLSAFNCGIKLLEKYPSFFTFGAFDRNGPTKEEMDEASFSMTLVGRGWSKEKLRGIDLPTAGINALSNTPLDKELVVRVSGPEAAYVSTPICMVQAGLVILRESDKLPREGGVYPPGAAFAKTSIIERLSSKGVKFEVVRSKNLK